MSSQSRIRTARRHAGLSQAQLALRIGVQRSAVSHWEDGTMRSPSVANMRQVAEVTGIHFEWLATGRGPMFVSSEALLDSMPAAEGVFIDDGIELRLIRAFRQAPVAGRIALVELAECLSATRRASTMRS